MTGKCHEFGACSWRSGNENDAVPHNSMIKPEDPFYLHFSTSSGKFHYEAPNKSHDGCPRMKICQSC